MRLSSACKRAEVVPSHYDVIMTMLHYDVIIRDSVKQISMARDYGFRQREKKINFFQRIGDFFKKTGAALHLFRPNDVVPLHKCESSCAAPKAFPSAMCNGFMAGQPGVQDLNVLSIPVPKIIWVKPLTRCMPKDDVIFEREPESESEDEILESITI
jgi:hypothetical protein